MHNKQKVLYYHAQPPSLVLRYTHKKGALFYHSLLILLFNLPVRMRSLEFVPFPRKRGNSYLVMLAGARIQHLWRSFHSFGVS